MTTARLYKRISAFFVDLFVGICLGLVMSHSVGYFFARRAVVMLKIGDSGSIWKGVIPFFMGIVGPFTYVLPLALYLVFISEPLFNTSPGKLIFNLKIVDKNGYHLTLKQKWLRHLIKTSPLWIMISGLMLGSWQLAILSVISTFILLTGLFLIIIGIRHISLYDNFADTFVIEENNSCR